MNVVNRVQAFVTTVSHIDTKCAAGKQLSIVGSAVQLYD